MTLALNVETHLVLLYDAVDILVPFSKYLILYELPKPKTKIKKHNLTQFVVYMQYRFHWDDSLINVCNSFIFIFA